MCENEKVLGKNRDLSNKIQTSYSDYAEMLTYFCNRKIFDYR